MLRHIALCVLIFCCLCNSVDAANIIQKEPQPLDSQQQLLLYRVYGLAEKTLALKEVTARTIGAALIADKLFLQSLTLLASQPATDVNQFALLGTYIFTSP